MTVQPVGLVGDIGGTNARFALVFEKSDGMVLRAPVSMRCADFPSLEAAVNSYLGQTGAKPTIAALAVAGPVTAEAVQMTNRSWCISGTTLTGVGISTTRLVNDYEALALAFADSRREPSTSNLGPFRPRALSAPLLVMGAGTGFGLAALVVSASGEPKAIATEAGHVGLAPADDAEAHIWRWLTLKYGRASLERALSGAGLADLHQALTGGENVEAPAAEFVTALAQNGDATALAAIEMFLTLLARAAGDFALAYGALGGVYLSDGVIERLTPYLDEIRFRRLFESKGRFGGFMRRVPTRFITDPLAALIGAAQALRGDTDFSISRGLNSRAASSRAQEEGGRAGGEERADQDA